MPSRSVNRDQQAKKPSRAWLRARNARFMFVFNAGEGHLAADVHAAMQQMARSSLLWLCAWLWLRKDRRHVAREADFVNPGGIKHWISHRTNVRMNPLQIAQNVKVE